MLRRLGLVLATCALMLGGLAAPAAAAPSVVGTWKAVDIDGSNLKLWMYSDLHVYGLDDDATVCGGGWAKFESLAKYINDRQFVVEWTVRCASGLLLGPYPVTFTHLTGGRLLDSLGVLWYPVP